jgi:hypothetical protein
MIIVIFTSIDIKTLIILFLQTDIAAYNNSSLIRITTDSDSAASPINETIVKLDFEPTSVLRMSSGNTVVYGERTVVLMNDNNDILSKCNTTTYVNDMLETETGVLAAMRGGM